MIRHRRIKCFGVGESDLEAMLPDMIRRKREPLVGITVSGATITLRITASGPNEAACRRAMEPTVAQIREMLGVLVFGEEDDELEHAVVRLLKERGQTVAVAEWATDGLVSQWLAEAPRASDCFRGGIVVRDAGDAQVTARYRHVGRCGRAGGNGRRRWHAAFANDGRRLRPGHRRVSAGGPAVPTAATLQAST